MTMQKGNGEIEPLLLYGVNGEKMVLMDLALNIYIA